MARSADLATFEAEAHIDELLGYLVSDYLVYFSTLTLTIYFLNFTHGVLGY